MQADWMCLNHSAKSVQQLTDWHVCMYVWFAGSFNTVAVEVKDLLPFSNNARCANTACTPCASDPPAYC